MGLARILGVCAALLFTASVSAANIIDLGPSDYRNFGQGASHTGAGLRSSFGQTTRLPPRLNTLTVTRNPVIPYGVIGNGLRTFSRVHPGSAAASAAVTSLFLAMSWYFDEEKGEWVKEEVLEIQYIDPLTGGWVGSGPDVSTKSTPAEACAGTFGCIDSGRCTPQHRPDWGPLSGICVDPATGRGSGTYMPANPVCPAGTDLTPLGCAYFETDVIELDPSDWQDLTQRLPQSDPNTVGQAARDTQLRIGAPLPGYMDTTITGPSSVSGPETTSTSTDPVTGDTIITTTNTTTNISYGDTTITTTNTTTATTYQNGQETSTTVTTETPGELPVSSGTESGDWPKFCDWATVVCDWFNWTREDPPPEQDLPSVIDDDFFEQKNISFGAKSCPPDLEISLAPFMDTTVGVSFQPFCDFAALIYYMVMAASYIIAAYISIGVARSA